MSTLRETIRELAARPQGMQTNEVHGVKRENVAKTLADMVARGQIYRGKLGHKSVWYFANLRDAEAFEAKHAKTIAGTVAGSFNRAWWGKDAEPVTTPETKFTACPPTQAGRHLKTDTHSIGRY